MMKLHVSPTSPAVRKVRIGAAMLGLSDRIELVPTDFMDLQDALYERNPLGKIPTMVLDDGLVLHDSAVILEYLDHCAGGGRLIPALGEARWRVLADQALADGMLDAVVLQVYEVRFRPEAKREAFWVERQAGKMERALDAFERRQPEGPRSVADIALASALGFLDLRMEGRWRADHPQLVAWLAAFAAEVPSFEETRFKG